MLADEKGIQIIFLAIGTNKAGDMCWLGFKNSQWGGSSGTWATSFDNDTMSGAHKYALQVKVE